MMVHDGTRSVRIAVNPTNGRISFPVILLDREHGSLALGEWSIVRALVRAAFTSLHRDLGSCAAGENVSGSIGSKESEGA
jgi:hypothetical protein